MRKWGNTLAALTTVLVTTVLSGCSGTAESAETSSASVDISAASMKNQLASIIAANDSSWRDVIDDAGTCRILMVGSSTNPVDKANLTACYAAEVTMGLTADTAIRELDSLQVPTSMQALVSDTKEALTQVTTVDLESACGPAFEGPHDSHECSLALGQRYAAYIALEPVLDSWLPYLYARQPSGVGDSQ